jgi:hypothetical protein
LERFLTEIEGFIRLNRIHEGTLNFDEYEETKNTDKKGRCNVDGGVVKRDGADAGKHPSGELHHDTFILKK